MSINLPMAILHRFLKVSKHMVYGHLIIEIYRAYKLDLEGYAVVWRIEYKVIESKIFTNANFHRLHYKDKTKPKKYHMLKAGEVRLKSPKA